METETAAPAQKEALKEAKKADGAKKRTRQHHTRSRTGCLTCRQRHIRCDEARPLCSNCMLSIRQCVYDPPKLPLRDRRAQGASLQPGGQVAWTVELASHPSSSLAASTSSAVSLYSSSPLKLLRLGSAADPFDTFPIQMPLKSRELFHYFFQAADTFGVMPTNQKHDCVALTVNDSFALRSTLLIAGLHYSWNVGSLQQFETTFFFHKMESMRTINAWLADSQSPASAIMCARLIATLCFTECCLGNLAIAETHLAGLVAFIDARDQQIHASGAFVGDVEAELVDRYFILTYNYLHGLKSRIKEFIRPAGGSPHDDAPARNADPAKIESMLRDWHKQARYGLHYRLRAMRQFPHFFSSPPPGRELRDIDAGPILRHIQRMTMLVDMKYRNETEEPGSARFWNDGGPSALFLTLINSHAESINLSSTKPHPEGALTCTWSAIAATVGIYLNCVLRLWNEGWLLEHRLHCRALLVLKRGIGRSERGRRGKVNDRAGSDLFFWMAFTGVFSFAHHGAHDNAARALRKWFVERARGWSEAAGVRKWEDALAALGRVAWPTAAADEQLVKKLWETTIRREG